MGTATVRVSAAHSQTTTAAMKADSVPLRLERSVSQKQKPTSASNNVSFMKYAYKLIDSGMIPMRIAPSSARRLDCNYRSARYHP
jgi:hypothetical protein